MTARQKTTWSLELRMLEKLCRLGLVDKLALRRMIAYLIDRFKL